jgi:ABC-type sugar transport system ATPase subunit
MRRAILAAAAEADLWLVADDPYGALVRDDAPMPRIVDLDAAVHGKDGVYRGRVAYLGTVSKSLAPGLRIGWIVAAPALIEALAVAKQAGELATSALAQGAALERIDVAIDPAATVGELSVAQQQQVENAKAIAADADLISLDEPTTALGPAEVAHLHALLRRRRDQRRAILYVSHRLDEVTALVDVATVMRGGRVVSDAATPPSAVDAFVRAMVGEVGEHYPKQRNATAERLLEVQGIATARGVRDVSFTLHRGEVLGLGGVLGSGRTEIARALFGLDPLTRGAIRLASRELRLAGPRDAIAAGLALLTENRKSDGLFLNLDGSKNVSIANLAGFSRHGIMDLVQERCVARRFIDKLQISPAAADRPVALLSGGNQQKMIISRWLNRGASVFILDEPTQGIDISAKVAVYRLINEITASGAGVILISTDDEELLAEFGRI